MTIQLIIVPTASLPAAVLEALARKAEALGVSAEEYVARVLRREAEEEAGKAS
jgi:hypothetical protein